MVEEQFYVGLQNLYPSAPTLEGHDLPVAHGHTFPQTDHANHLHGVNQSSCSVAKKVT